MKINCEVRTLRLILCTIFHSYFSEQFEQQGIEVVNGVAITRQFKTLFAKDQICLEGVRPVIPEYFTPQLTSLLERY